MSRAGVTWYSGGVATGLAGHVTWPAAVVAIVLALAALVTDWKRESERTKQICFIASTLRSRDAAEAIKSLAERK